MRPITDPLPPPRACDACSSLRVKYFPANGEYPARWRCRRCNASTTCHAGTNIPQGYMADTKTRRLRRELHEAFDPMWKQDYATRDEAYEWLARVLGLPTRDAHIGRLYAEDIEAIISRVRREVIKRERQHIKDAGLRNDKFIRQRKKHRRRSNGKWKAR